MNWRQWLRDRPITGKLRVVITSACAAVILPICVSFVLFDWWSYRNEMATILKVRATIMAANSSAAVAFQSTEDAREILGALAADKELSAAAIFDRNGELFVAYPAAAHAAGLEVRPVAAAEHRLEDGRLVVWAPVMHGDRRLGTLVMRHDLGSLVQRVRLHILVAFGLLLTAVLLGYLISASLQQLFSAPLLELAHTARAVTETKNFSQRARKIGDDEIGRLTDDFNAMLTQIQQREAALIESETRKSAIVESSEDAIISKTLEGIITSWNPAAERVFGYPAAEIINQPMMKLFPADRVNEEKEILARVGRGERVANLESVRLRKDGQQITVAESISPIRDARGTIIGVSKICRDITRQKKQSAALEQSEARFRTLTIATAQIVWHTGPTGEVVGPLPSWQSYTGQSEAEVQGFGWTGALHPDDVSHTTEIWKKALAAQGTYEVEYRIRRQDGIYRYFWVRGVPICNADGSVREWVGTCADITERRRAEQELRQSTERLTALNRLDRIISSSLDLGRVFAAFAREMSVLVSCDRAAFILMHPETDEWETVHRWSRDGGMGAATRGALANSGIGWVAETKRPLVEPEMNPAWSEAPLLRQAELRSRAMFPLVLQDRTVAVFVVASTRPAAFERDTVDFLQALADQLTVAVQNHRLFAEVRQHAADLERRVEERTAQLVATNKELEAFSYSVSHDLRAPLRAVAGFARILTEEHGPNLGADPQRYLGLIQDNAQRMGRLIDDLLSFSRLSKQALTKVKFDLGRLSHDVLQLLAPDLQGRKVDIRIGSLPEVQGDPMLMRQVMINLLSNAIKYSRPRTEAVVELGVKAADNGAPDPVFFVRDNGVGFDMKHAGKLFGVFQRLHRTDEFEGTGVGLAIVHRVIQRHGGRVWAESVPGTGTTISFTLPGEPNHENTTQQ